ncbi:hypothetical protein, conserved [Trypanosoma brucei gambiense DAL972]|uniref:Uncharacterized protein n=2 Tax=Trypanosoma brucei TaxID=5691 RepID=C9ZP97_TRYB9|nr:hypothetical protein, conserved [Trypanosoma brucei gambiense DAL972]CBH11225.1 hypothetical protein, conserved [Trypanosoma brucei gambiense DAL972]|eukprot:XP_011773512.1 hypothetical protein, conserved [Trypanosoma brucei gambiense DAL972]
MIAAEVALSSIPSLKLCPVTVLLVFVTSMPTYALYINVRSLWIFFCFLQQQQQNPSISVWFSRFFETFILIERAHNFLEYIYISIYARLHERMAVMRCILRIHVTDGISTRYLAYRASFLCVKRAHSNFRTGQEDQYTTKRSEDESFGGGDSHYPSKDRTTTSPASSQGSSDTHEHTAASSAEEKLSSASRGARDDISHQELEPMRWPQEAPGSPALTEPIIDEKGQFIVSRIQWPTGELAYATPPPPDTRVAPRFGYNVVQVKKHVSWWKHYQQHPRISVAYINIQLLFLLGAAWLMAFLVEEYRRVTDELRTPGAMVGEHRGRGPVEKGKQKISFTNDEMTSLIGRAQDNWMDARAEANYIGSKDYTMKKIPRPKEFSVDDFRKR